jgi:hypothetical protein
MFVTGNYRGYHIKFIRLKNTPVVHKHKKSDSWEKYNGKIYCVTVPNHIIYIRRNGKSSWTGNSFWSVALAIGAYEDFYSQNRKMGFVDLGNLQEVFGADKPKTESSGTWEKAKASLPTFSHDEHVCKICNKRGTLEKQSDGKVKCNNCFAKY